MVHFLLLELETVGNTGEPWFTSCYDLLLSRFCAWDYKAHHITGIKINRIIRIHNRALWQRFQDKALGKKRAPSPLSNSVSVSDRLRVTFMQKKSCSTSGSSPVDRLPFRHGQLIISKVFLGRSATAKEGLLIDCYHYPKANSVYLSTCSKEQKHTAQTAPDLLGPSSLPDSCDCRQQQKLWYMFDHEMVLPEYLVDFEYVTRDTSQPSPDFPSSSHTSPC